MTLADDRDTDYMVPALQRGMSILQMFNARQRTLGMSEMAERLGVSVSAIYRIAHTLTEMGYLRKSQRTPTNSARRWCPTASATWLAAT